MANKKAQSFRHGSKTGFVWRDQNRLMWFIAENYQHAFQDLRKHQNIQAWQINFNLNSAWVETYASRLLEAWQNVQTPAQLPALIVWGEFESIAPIKKVCLPEPYLETEEQYLEKVRGLARSHYKAQVRARGWVREPSLEYLEHHFRWLLERLMYKKSWEKIAREFPNPDAGENGTHRSAVTKAVEKLADATQISLD